MARKILLADDSVTAQNMGRKILADAGYEVIAVNNGSAALKKIAELKPDLVVLDVYMPGYSGLEVCQRLKEAHDTARIPVLLTVGKLEPFKPEEAQRVRAEAFIVKPFEASELLSALSKLEDKVVPRAEPSRPGRFARAFAAAEESVRTPAGEENGWKSRISFPHEKTEAEEKAEKAEQPEIYNAINRDLRTIVETPQEKAQQQAHQPEQDDRSSGLEVATVDVAALAPFGVSSSDLPKNVSQEELAAIAAAAAQIQLATAAVEDRRASETASQAAPEAILQAIEAPETVGFEPPMREIDLNGAAPPVVESPAASENTALATQASPSQDSKDLQDVPVTIAATADSAPNPEGASRWAAVAVALEEDEAGLLLEREMHQASALQRLSVDSAPANGPYKTPSPTAESPVEAPAPAALQEPLKMSEAAAVVFGSPVESAFGQSASLPASANPEVTMTMASPPAAERENDSVQTERAPQQAAETGEAVAFSQDAAALQAAVGAPSADDFTGIAQPEHNEFAGQSFAPKEISEPSPEEEAAPEYSIPAQEAAGEVDIEIKASGYRAFRSIESAGEAASVPDAEIKPQPEPEPEPGNESVRSTAAAWATWRQIRDAGKPAEAPKESSNHFDVPEPARAEANAAAVAAGAEHMVASITNSEESANSADVASIVDSVLADLRPKLMQEISRKMAEKK